MRRLLVLAVTLVAVLGIMAPPVMAQAPAPKVTITGFIDEIGTYTRNMSHYDFDYNRANDVQAYGRTRGRFDIIGEVGKAKAVLGIELDMYYGQTGSADNNIQGNATSAGFGASRDRLTFEQFEIAIQRSAVPRRTFAFLFILIWLAWSGHTLYCTRFDTDDLIQRVLVLVQSFIAAVMAAISYLL